MKIKILMSFFSCILLQESSLANPPEDERHNVELKDLDIETFNHVIIGGNFYYISPIQASVNAWIANRFCDDEGLKLISFNNEEKMQQIYDYLSNNEYSGRGFWTSGKQLIGGDWRWGATGESLNFTDWQPGQPEFSWTEPEVCLWFRPAIGWYDDSCQGGFYFICEYV